MSVGRLEFISLIKNNDEYENLKSELNSNTKLGNPGTNPNAWKMAKICSKLVNDLKPISEFLLLDIGYGWVGPLQSIKNNLSNSVKDNVLLIGLDGIEAFNENIKDKKDIIGNGFKDNIAIFSGSADNSLGKEHNFFSKIKEDTVDIITENASFKHMNNNIYSLNQVTRVLREGGFLISSKINMHIAIDFDFSKCKMNGNPIISFDNKYISGEGIYQGLTVSFPINGDEFFTCLGFDKSVGFPYDDLFFVGQL